MQYAILALLSTILGAVAGIGGGIIIRPLLALMGVGKELASFTVALTVLAMSIANLISHRWHGTELRLHGTLMLALGSLCGGFAGGSLMGVASTGFINASYIAVLLLVLIVVVKRSSLPAMTVKNPLLQGGIGLLTGTMSGFYGIGGGPFQMAALLLFFNLTPRDAAVQSVMITMITTASALLRYSLAGYADFSLSLFTVPAGILGGILGSVINRRLTNRWVSGIFGATIATMLVIQCVKVFGSLLGGG